MPRNPKREPSLARIPSSAKSLKPLPDPYPDLSIPTPEQCRAVRDALLAHDGFPEEFAKYRRSSDGPLGEGPETVSDGSDVGRGALRETVLDGLVSTLLSQNTTDSNSRRAFESLKSAFPSWNEVLAAESKLVENAIRCGGLAATKAARIKSILRAVMEKRGEICLEYLRGMSVDEVKAELSQFKGIGPKTVTFSSSFLDQMSEYYARENILIMQGQKSELLLNTKERKADRTEKK